MDGVITHQSNQNQITNDLARVMRMLRHSSEGVTLRYIGITQDDIDKDFVELEL